MSTTRIISVANRKGGVGKTTLSILLATALAVDKKKKVYFIDCDSQKSALQRRQFEQQSYGEEEKIPYPIDYLPPRYLYDELRIKAEKYDVIFVDVPRLTDDSKDSDIITILTCCDSVLVPTIPGELDAFSTKDFISTVVDIAEHKEKLGIPFNYHGFLNKRNRRTESSSIIDFMNAQAITMFDSNLDDLKIFTSPSTYFSILETPQGKERFAPFLKEFIKKFKL